ERKHHENRGRSGGAYTVDVNSPEIIRLAEKVMNTLNSNQRIKRILNAKQQVVAGTLTTLDLEVCPAGNVSTNYKLPTTFTHILNHG
ncbi:unnamed protein product, partial [Allacma fusca]